MAGAWDVPRFVICSCGRFGTFKNLEAANAAMERHKEIGSEGCDHTMGMAEVLPGPVENHELRFKETLTC